MSGRRKVSKLIPFMFVALLVGSPVLAPQGSQAGEPQQAAQSMENVYQGQVTGYSKKAKTITIDADGTSQMVKVDDSTEGLDHIQVGHAAIVTFEVRGKDKVAVSVKPKLAKLPEGVTDIGVDEIAGLIASGKAGNYLLVDSRPKKRYDQGHIPTAVSIPADVLEEKKEAVLPADKDTLLVFYCGGVTCGLSPKSAGMAKKMGYTKVRAMLVGEPGWQEAGHRVVAAMDFVKKGNIVLVDLRSPEEAAAGHIPRAVNLPFAGLAGQEDLFPAKKSAPIVVYGNGDEAEQAAGTIMEWGYKNVALVPGGLAGWQQAGNELATGPVATEIKWVRTMEKGEVSAADFRAVAEAGSEQAVILDVRTNDEVAEGKFAGALHIPLDEIENRLAELPLDRELLVHCTTGARAEMAAKQLIKAGHKARFLVADVACTAEGCTISE